VKPKKLVVAGVGVSLALAVSACGSSTKTSSAGSSNTTGSSSGSGQATGTPYQVGFDSSLSGPYAANGVGERDGFMSYIKYVNSHGGVNGHPVNVTVTDDAADVSTATANETQLIAQNHVSAVAGWLLSNACGAAANIATAQQNPIICSAVATTLVQPVHPYVYTSRNLQQDEAKPMADFAKTIVKSSSPRVAIIIYGSAASSGLQTGLGQQAKANGWNVVANLNVPLTQSDVSAQAAQVVASKPDVIMGSLYDPLAVSFMRAMEAQKVTAPFINYDGATLSGSLNPLKDPNYYVVSSTTLTGEGTGSGLAIYRDATQANGTSATGPFVNVGYVEAIETVNGLKGCGFPCSGTAMQKALDKLNVDTAGVTTGPITYSPTNHDTLDQFSIYSWNSSSQAVTAAASGLSS
jgi:branched-chain amino acid transport system substrate-binding protein